MIPRRTRNSPPMIKMNAETSPMEPDILPRKRSRRDRSVGRIPCFIEARGVADETISGTPLSKAMFLKTGRLETLPKSPAAGYAENQLAQAKRKTRPHSAGFMKLEPRPPKSCFAITIAKKSATITIQYGMCAGTQSTIRIPVTTAEKSEID